MAVYSFLIFALILHTLSEIDATSYASLESPDGFFKLQWTYNNSKLLFKMTCKTTGWCAVGFTKTADGKNMVNYDIAVAGYASGAGYIKDYWSTFPTTPPQDGSQNYILTSASESGGQTVVEFSRDVVTGDAKDLQFANDTEVKVVYAYHTSSDANAGLPKHSVTGILSGKHNLISMAMLAMQPSSTTAAMQPSPTTATLQPSPTTATMQPSPTTATMQPSSTTEAMQPSSGIHASATVMRPTASMDSGGSTAKPPSYASLVSPDGFFKLQWTYSNSKLLFKMTCKTTGWCAVGFTKTADGKNMVKYDIAVAGYASGAGYVDDYWSTTIAPPPKDAKQNFNLTKASEDDGYTVVEFSRDAITGDNANDVQFTDDTEVTVVWASRTSSDANYGLSKHSKTGIFSDKHNLIKEAMSAMQSTLAPPKGTAGVIVPHFVCYVVVACLSAYFLFFRG